MTSITNTYFDYLTNNFLSLLENPKQLLKIWFNLNYPEYFNILKIDNRDKIFNKKNYIDFSF